jgi:hypothetical protein
MLTIFLFILLVFIKVFPSGPECPECKSYFTHEFDLNAINKKTKTEHKLLAKVCYKCNHRWDMYKDGKRVTTFLDEIEEEADDE